MNDKGRENRQSRISRREREIERKNQIFIGETFYINPHNFQMSTR
jgi:hypothetical protein